MNKMILNNVEIPIESFNRTTNFSNGTMNSMAYVNVSHLASADDLQDLGNVTITNLQLVHDDEVVYSLENCNAEITMINESLYDGGMNINLNINFN